MSAPVSEVGTVSLAPDIAAWATYKGFVPSSCAGCLEIAWAHSSGYGYITLRLFPLARHADDRGCEVIVETGHGDGSHGVNLGACETLAAVREVYSVLAGLAWREDRGASA